MISRKGQVTSINLNYRDLSWFRIFFPFEVGFLGISSDITTFVFCIAPCAVIVLTFDCWACCTELHALHVFVANFISWEMKEHSFRMLIKGYIAQAYNLSRDHKPDLEAERERILKAGGFIHAGRVNGSLNLARAIGICFINLLLSPQE